MFARYGGRAYSWYIDASGDPNLYSHPPQRFYKDMNAPVFAEYELLSPSEVSVTYNQ
jgi:hypothetical protein